MSSSVSHPAGDQINVMSTFSVEFIITKYPTASQGWIRKRLKAVRSHWRRHKRLASLQRKSLTCTFFEKQLFNIGNVML